MKTAELNVKVRMGLDPILNPASDLPFENR